MAEDQKLNWVSVLNFLQKEYSKISLRQKQWQYERQLLNQRINNLEAELRSNVIVCQNMVNRIKVLQIALKEEKIKKGNQKSSVDQDKIKNLVQQYQLTQKIEKNSHQEFLKEIVKDLRVLQKQIPRAVEREEESIAATFGKTVHDKKFEEMKKIGAHLDVVTMVIPLELNQDKFIATCSEDCLIKIWNMSKLLKEDSPEPVHTLRKHTGPLFALSSSPHPKNNSQLLLFSGGIEGDIKSWSFSAGRAQWTRSWSNGQEEQQTIWQLQAQGDRLLSSSSDGFIRLFKISGTQQIELSLAKNYKEKQFNQTAVKWVSEELFVTGSSSAPRINLWNIEGSIQSKFLYEVQKGKEAAASQVNRLEILRDRRLIVAGCEDTVVRLFDITTGKIIKKLETKGAVGALLGWEWNLLAGDHKGCISNWDVRTFRLIQQKQDMHLTKYDSGITSLTRSGQYLIIGGADGLLKVLI